jgi:hypothetical protein
MVPKAKQGLASKDLVTERFICIAISGLQLVLARYLRSSHPPEKNATLPSNAQFGAVCAKKGRFLNEG